MTLSRDLLQQHLHEEVSYSGNYVASVEFDPADLARFTRFLGSDIKFTTILATLLSTIVELSSPLVIWLSPFLPEIKEDVSTRSYPSLNLSWGIHELLRAAVHGLLSTDGPEHPSHGIIVSRTTAIMHQKNRRL